MKVTFLKAYKKHEVGDTAEINASEALGLEAIGIANRVLDEPEPVAVKKADKEKVPE